MNVPRADNWGASLGGKVYNLGGYSRLDPTYKPLSTVEVLDPATGRWTYVANMTIPRWALPRWALPRWGAGGVFISDCPLVPESRMKVLITQKTTAADIITNDMLYGML